MTEPTADLIWCALVGGALGWLISGYLSLKRRIVTIEKRDWPMKVVEWRTLQMIPTCRCQLAEQKGDRGEETGQG